MHSTTCISHKHAYKHCSNKQDSQIYIIIIIIIYSMSFINSKYTYEVSVPVDIYDSQELLYIILRFSKGMLFQGCAKNLIWNQTKLNQAVIQTTPKFDSESITSL